MLHNAHIFYLQEEKAEKKKKKKERKKDRRITHKLSLSYFIVFICFVFNIMSILNNLLLEIIYDKDIYFVDYQKFLFN